MRVTRQSFSALILVVSAAAGRAAEPAPPAKPPAGVTGAARAGPTTIELRLRPTKACPQPDQPIFPPQTAVDVAIEVRPGAEPPGRITVEMRPSHSLQSLFRVDQAITSSNIPSRYRLHVRLPEREGAYDLIVRTLSGAAGEEAGRSDLDGGEPPIRALPEHAVEQRMQFLVLSATSPADGPRADRPPGGTPVEEIDPTGLGSNHLVLYGDDLASRPHDRRGVIMGERSGLRAMAGRGLRSLFRRVRAPQPPLEVLPPARPGRPSWVAIGLQVHQPGCPHLISIEYLDQPGQALSASLCEADGGRAPVVSGVASGERASGAWDRHCMVVWPQTTAPILVLANHATNREAVFGTIRVQVFAAGLPPLDLPDPGPATDRLIGPYDGGDFAARCTRGSDDWTGPHRSATELVEYLRYAGYNSLLLTVQGPHGTLFPRHLLDTGEADPRAPPEPDRLELLLRLFDREHLRLVPTLEWGQPIAELEDLAKTDRPDRLGIELISAEGRTWRQAHPDDAAEEPIYNPLDPKVQEAVLRSLRRLAARYRRHPSFAGLGVTLRIAGYTQMPSLDWGYDDATVARFRQETGLAVPGEDDRPERFRRRYDYLTGTVRAIWIDWRCRQLTAWYGRAAHQLRQVCPDARLVLAPLDLLRDPAGAADPYAWFREGRPADQWLRQQGLDVHQFGNQQGLVVLRPGLAVPRGPAAPRAGETAAPRARDIIAQDLNGTLDLDTPIRELPGRGSIWVHAGGPADLGGAGVEASNSPEMAGPQAALPGVEAVEPEPPRLVIRSSGGEGPAADPWLGPAIQAALERPAYVAAGRGNLTRWAHTLASLDAAMIFDGGWSLARGQEPAVREFAAAYRRLPAGEFREVGGSHQPVVVRYQNGPDRTVIYVVNDATYPTAANLSLRAAAGASVRSTGRVAPSQRPGDEPGTSGLGLTLEPAAVVALRLDDPHAAVEAVTAEPTAEARKALEQTAARLQRAMAVLTDPQESEVAGLVENSGFEAAEAEPGPDRRSTPGGWQKRGAAAVTWGLDGDHPHGGRWALKLSSPGPTGWVQSNPFQPPRLRSLAMRLWLRADRPDLAVRLSFEGRHGRIRYQRAATVRIDPRWRQFLFRVMDLPEDRLDDLAVRITLPGAGVVWIDDVELCRLPVTEIERRRIIKTSAAAMRAWEQGRYADFSRLAQSYWPQFLLDLNLAE